MTASVGTREGRQLHATPLSMLLDLTGLEVEARKNILQALKDSHARELQLQAEVQTLREQLERARTDRRGFGGQPAAMAAGRPLAEETDGERRIG